MEFYSLIYTIQVIVSVVKSLNPHWISGFVDGEGCFSINVHSDKSYLLGSRVKLNFSISQHRNNVQQLGLIQQHFLCGGVHKGGRPDLMRYQVGSTADIINVIIPFFDTYPLKGIKAQDYADFRKVAQMIQDGTHLTKDGQDKIRLIAGGINTKRKFTY